MEERHLGLVPALEKEKINKNIELWGKIAEEYIAAKDIMEYFLIARDAIRKCLQKKERILSYIWIDVYKARFLYRLSEVVREYNERYKELYEEANDREMDLLRGKYKNPR